MFYFHWFSQKLSTIVHACLTVDRNLCPEPVTNLNKAPPNVFDNITIWSIFHNLTLWNVAQHANNCVTFPFSTYLGVVAVGRYVKTSCSPERLSQLGVCGVCLCMLSIVCVGSHKAEPTVSGLPEFHPAQQQMYWEEWWWHCGYTVTPICWFGSRITCFYEIPSVTGSFSIGSK